MIQTNRTTLKLCLLFLALSFFGNEVMFPLLLNAQVSVPPAGESGVGQKALEQSRPDFQPPKEELPPLSIKDSRSVVDPGAGPRFIVKKIEVTGNTLVDDATLAAVLEVGDGLEVTLGILHLIAQEITSLYSTKGYILARAFVPEQEIENGTVTIQVVEGRLGKIEVTGNEKFEQEAILARLKPLLNNPALKESTLEKYLLGLNTIQGLKIKAVLKPGEASGTSDLILQVEESRSYQVAFDADNFGSRFTGEQRYGLTGEVGSMFALGDRLSVRGVTSDEDQFFVNPSYSIPIGPYDTTLTLSYTHTDFNLGGNLAVLNAGGKANIFTVDISHTLMRTRGAEFHLGLGGDVRDFSNDLGGAASSNDKLRDAFFEAGGFFKDSLRGHTFYSLRLQQGFSESDVSDPLSSRFQGRGDTLLTSIDVTRFQSSFIGKSYFMLKARGQVSTKRVLSPDQFAIGGFGSVRGYPLAEAAGDNGYFVSTELIVPFPFKVNVLNNPRPVQLGQILSFFAFLDHGAVFIKNRQAGERDQDLSGAGLGFRLNVSSLGPNYPSVSFALAYGFPVFGGPDPSDGSSNTLYLNGMISF